MENTTHFDAIIIGGSYAGLSAAMALGRSIRNVLIIDSGQPCNQQTPFSHNFITQDGVAPAKIAKQAKKQVLEYPTVKHLKDKAVSAKKENEVFTVATENGSDFTTQKLLFATGVKDHMPDIPGFSECWGISVLHCPYCHGYEVKNQPIGILANGEVAFELCQLIQHWTQNLTLFTNGQSTLNKDQTNLIKRLDISLVEKEVDRLQHQSGSLDKILFRDGSSTGLSAIFSRVEFEQHCKIPMELGCKLTEQGHIEVDDMQKTSVDGIFAAGDNTVPFRTVSIAVAAGTKAGAVINMELIGEKIQAGELHPSN